MPTNSPISPNAGQFDLNGNPIAPASTGGAGTGNGSFNITSGTNPNTGFARQYTPQYLNNIIWDSPWAVLPDTFQGMNINGPGYQAMRDLGADPLTLYNIMQGGGGNDLTGAGAAGFANFMNALYTSMGTPGGRGFSTRELLGNIRNAGEDSALGKIMTSGDAGTQVRTLFNLIRESTNAGMNPLAARGYQSAAARQGDQYLNQVMKSPAADQNAAGNTPFYQWMRSQGYL